MRRLSLTVFLLLMGTVLTAYGQGSATYRLRVPTATEYIEAIPAVTGGFLGEGCYNNSQRCRFPNMLLAEIAYRYDHLDASYAALSRAYSILFRGTPSEPAIRTLWTQELVRGWLLENPLNLDNVTSLGFDDFVLEITAQDLDGDGANEWVLDVDKTGSLSYEYSSVWVVRRDEAGQYQFVDTPLPMYRSCCAHEYDIRMWGDVGVAHSGDGVAEVVVVTNASSRYDPMNSGRVYALGWRNGAMVDLFEQAVEHSEPRNLRGPYDTVPYFLPAETRWSFTADSGVPAIVQYHWREDNWLCRWLEITRYPWRNGHFQVTAGNSSTEYPETMGCALHNAERAMWDHHYEEAIPLYQRALYLSFSGDTSSTTFTAEERQALLAERRPYIYARLALAYILTGQPEQAAAMFTEAQAGEIESDVMAGFVAALAAHQDDPYQMCVAAYEFFAPYSEGSTPGTLIDYAVGAQFDPRDYHENLIGSRPPPDPALAGCDVTAYLDQYLTENPISDSPVEQLEAAGILIEDSFVAELNGDGVEDWLVWPVSAVPLLFVSTPGDAYAVSHTELPRPGDNASLFAQPLPDGTALVRILTDVEQFTGSWFTCPDGDDRAYPRAQVEVWQLREYRLQNTLTAMSCDLPTRETLFSTDATVLHVWMQPEVEFGDFFFSPASYAYAADYLWDSAQQTFIAPEPVYWTLEAVCETYPDSCPAEGTMWRMGGFYPGVSLLGKLDGDMDLAALLAVAEQQASAELVPSLAAYERAVILEAMGDTEAALAAYVDLYTATPASSWGVLVALHLELGS